MMDAAYADALILFGISGDLARKKLFSALYDLTAAGGLDMPVIGVAWGPAETRALLGPDWDWITT